MGGRAIYCTHEKTVESDGEIVCRRCGVVIQEQESVVTNIYEGAKSSVNLFEMRSIGGRDETGSIPDCGARLERYFRGGVSESDPTSKRHLSKFSNICEKLGFNSSLQNAAWDKFAERLKYKNSREVAETASWAIHMTCKEYGLPIPPVEILRVVQWAFNRSRMPHMSGIIYDNLESSVPDFERDKRYYFNLNLRRIAGDIDYNDAEVMERREQAWRLYNEVYTEGNPDQNSRNAINEVFER